MDAATFKRLTPLAVKIGDVLAGKKAHDVEIALGMLIGLQCEAPEDLEETLENIRLAAAKHRLYQLELNEKH